MSDLNTTHDPARRSWIAAANEPGHDFPVQNLPFGLMRRDGGRHCCIAIGDSIFDLHVAGDAGVLDGVDSALVAALRQPDLNAALARPQAELSALRHVIFELLAEAGGGASKLGDAASTILVPQDGATLLLPMNVGSFTDFLCSYDHTMRMGRGSLPPAFHHLPIAYNSRATSLCASGTPIRRPNGQFSPKPEDVRFGPEPSLDFELELGAFVRAGNGLGDPVAIGTAADCLAGFCLLNDWSARGIQFFESMPLGPFLGKSFATTISPWIVTPEALAPFRVAPPRRAGGVPPVPAYLSDARDQAEGAFDIELTASLRTPAMRKAGHPAATIVRTNFSHMHWTFAQMLTHHASNGCNLQNGDLLGSGTASGPHDESRACLAELTERGSTLLQLPGGETRTWLQDGDEIAFTGHAQRQGFVSVGFGACSGMIEPAPQWPRG